MADEKSKIDTSKLEEEVERTMAEGLASQLARPRVVPMTEDRNRQAMAAVKRHIDVERMKIEAFVDEAIHVRVVAQRGSYLPGPRDTYVRKMCLDAIDTIRTDNADTFES